MGCDIHLHTEIKVKGTWHHYSEPHVWRDYGLFYFLSGIRGKDFNPSPLIPHSQEGLPKDASVVTRMAFDECRDDWHDEGWLDAEGIITLETWLREHPSHTDERFITKLGYLFGNSWSGFLRNQKAKGGEYPMEIEDIRFVLWYDN